MPKELDLKIQWETALPERDLRERQFRHCMLSHVNGDMRKLKEIYDEACRYKDTASTWNKIFSLAIMDVFWEDIALGKMCEIPLKVSFN